MTAEISARVPDLQAKGSQLMQKADQGTADLQSITALAQASDIFRGAAATQYHDAYHRWHTAQQQMIQALRDLGGFLQNAAVAMEKQDQALAAQLGISVH
jgi:WXG100 family type VII secretion target